MFYIFTTQNNKTICLNFSSKIIDVDQLERQIEDGSTRNWTIKATIRGQVMRELGVIYNSNYYAISEHPNFSFSKRIHVSEGKK